MKGCLEPIFYQWGGKVDREVERNLEMEKNMEEDREVEAKGERVKQDGFQRIYFDLPGMGRTELHSDLTSSDDIFSIVLEFIDTILPDTQFILAGNSYGGYLARGILRQRPEQVLGLLLICPLIEPVQSKRTVPQRTILHRDESLATILSDTEKEEFDYGATIQTEEIWLRYDADIMSAVRVSQLELLEHIAETSYPLSFDVDALDSPFMGPSLFLMGRQDSVVGYEDALKLADLYPNAEMVVIDRAGHSLEIEQPELFDQHVKNWLSRVNSHVWNWLDIFT